MGIGSVVNIIFTLVMLALCFVDYRTFGTQKHRDFKSIIMSTGVLGTFVGIFIGLLDFDTMKIEESVPLLLEGLKVAFYTSILGMGLAILLTIFQKSKNVKSDAQVATDYFTQQASRLDLLDSLPKIVKILEEQTLFFRNVQEQRHSEYKGMYELLELHFGEIRNALELAIKQLARGASQEIISALEAVIKDFNQNLSAQFGENFKELNAATINMISWQENYKSSIESIEKNLTLSQSALESSSQSLEKIHERNAEVQRFYEELGALISTYKSQNSELSAHLESFALLRENAQASVNGLNELFNDATRKLVALGTDTSESIQKTQEALLQNSHFLQEESHKEIAKLLEETKEAQAGIREVMRNQSDELNQHIAREMEDSRTKVSEHLYTLKDKFSEAITSLKTNLSNNTNDFIHTIQESAQGAREHLIAQEQIYHERGIELFNALLAHFNETGEHLVEQNRAKIQEVALESKQFFEDFTTQWRGDHELLKETILGNNLQIKESFTGMTQSALGELFALAKGFSESIHNMEATISRVNDALAQKTLQTLQTYEKTQIELFQKSANSISENLAKLSEGTQKTLKNLALEYVKLLQRTAKESISTPKEVSATILDEFSHFQKGILESIYATNQTLLANRQEIEGFLKLLQENIHQSLEHTNVMNRNLHTTLHDLDSALASMTNDFMHDYEWFLRRIRELIGSRSAF